MAEDFSGEKVVEAVQAAWQALADCIYQQDLSELATEHTKAIWQRQVKHFWEMSWVMTADEADSSGLDRRKNWRSHYLPAEPGIKCSLMGDWQELSGIVGVRRKDREAREQFWYKLYQGKNSNSDFQNDGREYLCAMAFIKRRFVRHFAAFSTKIMDGRLTIYGWKIPSAVPSIAYIAAAPWFAEVIRQEGKQSDALQTFIAATKYAGCPEYESNLRCIEEAKGQAELSKKDIGIDGNMFHEIALDNPNICPDQAAARSVKKALKTLTAKHGAISPFYAVLMMDGDSLGSKMGIIDNQKPITDALNAFTKNVPKIIHQHNGFLIYAGGDDVLALLPLEDALSAAAHLRWHYQQCFHGKKLINVEGTPTISAAIIYSHINHPLKNILRDAHHVLDDIAKEGVGRDALAVRVYKGSSIALQWGKKWAQALVDETRPDSPYYLDQILADFKKQEKAEDEGRFSSKFFYRIRQRFALFASEETAISDQHLWDVLCMDFIQSADNKKLRFEDAQKMIATLQQQSHNPITNHSEVDAALLVRFLAQKGIERGGQ